MLANDSILFCLGTTATEAERRHVEISLRFDTKAVRVQVGALIIPGYKLLVKSDAKLRPNSGTRDGSRIRTPHSNFTPPPLSGGGEPPSFCGSSMPVRPM